MDLGLVVKGEKARLPLLILSNSDPEFLLPYFGPDFFFLSFRP
jgi:hypothetical protein